MAKELSHITKSKNTNIDYEPNFQFHATLAISDIHQKFDDIWDYLKTYPVKSRGVCHRITLLNSGRIICEYDLVQKRVLSRREALSKRGWKLTGNSVNQTNKLGNDETQIW